MLSSPKCHNIGVLAHIFWWRAPVGFGVTETKGPYYAWQEEVCTSLGVRGRVADFTFLMSKIFYINNKALQYMSSVLVLFQNA